MIFLYFSEVGTLSSFLPHPTVTPAVKIPVDFTDGGENFMFSLSTINQYLVVGLADNITSETALRIVSASIATSTSPPNVSAHREPPRTEVGCFLSFLSPTQDVISETFNFNITAYQDTPPAATGGSTNRPTPNIIVRATIDIELNRADGYLKLFNWQNQAGTLQDYTSMTPADFHNQVNAAFRWTRFPALLVLKSTGV